MNLAVDPTALGISVRDAARQTSLSEYEIREAINQGDLPAVKRGRRIVIDGDGLRAWFKALPPAREPASP